MNTDTPRRSPAALVLLAGLYLDVAGLDADAIAASLDRAASLDTRDTYGAHGDAAVMDLHRTLYAVADRLSGTVVRGDTVTVTLGGDDRRAATARGLYRLADDLVSAICNR